MLGLGTGRCGSTTLTAAFASLADACATHENPPLLNWDPCEEQVSFHIKRLQMMAGHYALVFDASHWWLNVTERVMAECDGTKVIGMVRDTPSCVRSFLAVKGRGRGSVNHWALPDNGIWGTTHGDPTYPCYEVPLGLHNDPDAAKTAQVDRYVRSYNEALATLAGRHPERSAHRAHRGIEQRVNFRSNRPIHRAADAHPLQRAERRQHGRQRQAAVSVVGDAGEV